MPQNNQQITFIPDNIWYVTVNGKEDSRWSTRNIARSVKTKLTSYGVKNVKIGKIPVSVGLAVIDTHS
jgi:hypothetical protein